MNNENVVLFITEGERLDRRILQKVKSLFFNGDFIKIFPICLNIYNLYKKISDHDDFGTEFIDIFAVIKEISQEQENSNNPEFLALRRNQISEIFLFFDYDGHDGLASVYPNCINEMLALFNDETQNGKLYINYPMIESYKHNIQQNVELVDISPRQHYKTYVSANCDKKLEQVNKLKKEDWLKILLPHIQSTNYLFCDNFSLPETYLISQEMSQISIYHQQNEKYIQSENKIMVLSSFSWFLLEYLGEPLFNEWENLVS